MLILFRLCSSLMKIPIILRCKWCISKHRGGATLISPIATWTCEKELQIIWCSSECWNFYLFDVWIDVTTTHNDWWIHTSCPLFWVLTGCSLNKKCRWHYKESYGPLGGRSERGITRLHTAGSVQTCYSNDSKELDYHPTQGEWEKKKTTYQYTRNENRCLSNLWLNGVRLQIVLSAFHPISQFVTHSV